MIVRKKLVVDCRMLRSSGIGRYIQELIPFLSQSFETTVIIRLEDIAFAHIHNLKYLISEQPIYSVQEQLAFFKLNLSDSCFWSPHYNVPFLPFKSKARIVTIHDVSHLALSDHLSWEKKIYARMMIRKAVMKSDKVITVSHFSKEEIIKYTNCSASKIEVIYNGMKQEPLCNSWPLIKKKYALPDKYVLYVGNVKPHKNLKCLLEAYYQLGKGMRDEFKVVIVGRKNGFITEDKQLFEWIDTNQELKDNIYFTGFVDEPDLDTIYSSASLLVFPSFYEGFGFPPLEAMVNNCPVISSNSSSLPEVCGNAALYFNPHNSNELRELIEKTLSDHSLRTCLINKGKERFKKFTWENSITAHVKIFGTLE